MSKQNFLLFLGVCVHETTYASAKFGSAAAPLPMQHEEGKNLLVDEGEGDSEDGKSTTASDETGPEGDSEDEKTATASDETAPEVQEVEKADEVEGEKTTPNPPLPDVIAAKGPKEAHTEDKYKLDEIPAKFIAAVEKPLHKMWAWARNMFQVKNKAIEHILRSIYTLRDLMLNVFFKDVPDMKTANEKHYGRPIMVKIEDLENDLKKIVEAALEKLEKKAEEDVRKVKDMTLEEYVKGLVTAGGGGIEKGVEGEEEGEGKGEKKVEEKGEEVESRDVKSDEEEGEEEEKNLAAHDGDTEIQQAQAVEAAASSVESAAEASHAADAAAGAAKVAAGAAQAAVAKAGDAHEVAADEGVAKEADADEVAQAAAATEVAAAEEAAQPAVSSQDVPDEVPDEVADEKAADTEVANTAKVAAAKSVQNAEVAEGAAIEASDAADEARAAATGAAKDVA